MEKAQGDGRTHGDRRGLQISGDWRKLDDDSDDDDDDAPNYRYVDIL